MSCAAAIAASTPSVTNVKGASGCACTQSVGTSCVTTTTGAPMVCRPPQPSVTSNSVRPTTIAPSESIHARQYAADCGVMWKVMSGVAVGTSTSPLFRQSKSRPMVLSALAM